MKLASIRLLTSRLDELVEFYELVTGATFERPNPVFAELITAGGTLAIGGDATLPLFPGTGLTVASNTSAILEFQVDDVDDERARLGDRVQVVQEPTTMPWGNRAMMLVDPDGNRVNLYAPCTDEAKARFAGR
ncbi:VOC family protein [Microbacterium sp. ARD32]|uniref:VOC family protein n=1 Tax=Microbacterium sp. ARD32 TaxID=2962577 RepID=UPI00288174FA|nr:VOC family protein [Microbacterium sp. ARD32]MDT0156642.1 VOC family protein [Microbacterium sp. ARD32]